MFLEPWKRRNGLLTKACPTVSSATRTLTSPEDVTTVVTVVTSSVTTAVWTPCHCHHLPSPWGCVTRVTTPYSSAAPPVSDTWHNTLLQGFATSEWHVSQHTPAALRHQWVTRVTTHSCSAAPPGGDEWHKPALGTEVSSLPPMSSLIKTAKTIVWMIHV